MSAEPEPKHWDKAREIVTRTNLAFPLEKSAAYLLVCDIAAALAAQSAPSEPAAPPSGTPTKGTR